MAYRLGNPVTENLTDGLRAGRERPQRTRLNEIADEDRPSRWVPEDAVNIDIIFGLYFRLAAVMIAWLNSRVEFGIRGHGRRRANPLAFEATRQGAAKRASIRGGNDG
jgi:hypothetical protein